MCVCVFVCVQACVWLCVYAGMCARVYVVVASCTLQASVCVDPVSQATCWGLTAAGWWVEQAEQLS